MTRMRLPPFPCVQDELRSGIAASCSLHFTSPGGPDPGERETAPERYTFGTETDWSIEQHPLRVECRFIVPDMLAGIFGPDGLLCRSAKLMLALEWVSSSSSRRGFSKPHVLSAKDVAHAGELSFILEFPARELAGTIQVTLELLVGAQGKPAKDELHLANAPGLRLGAVSDTWTLVFDGSGSLFPILHVSHSPTDPLWRFSCHWEDPTFDEFSIDFVSLEVNTSHPTFTDLYGDAKSPYSTPLFRQVLASWLMLFLDELKQTDGIAAPGASISTWTSIVEGRQLEHFLPGSIANAAREFYVRGNLNASSNAELLYSAQRWIDERFGASE